MRLVRYILVLAMMFVVIASSAKGSKERTVYMFGFSASFNDSIVYFTPVQEVKAYIADDRTHFLVNREQYSYQMRNYFENRGQLHRTCLTIYSLEKDKAEKELQKLKEKYTTKSKNKFDVVYLSDDDFKFETVTPDEGTYYVDPKEAEMEASKAERKTKDKGSKKAKGKPKDAANK